MPMKRTVWTVVGLALAALAISMFFPRPRQALAQGVLTVVTGTPGSAVPAGVLMNGASDGTNTASLQMGSAANSSAAVTGNKALIVDVPGQWTVTNNPVAATQATASKSAGAAGVRHVADCITVGLTPIAAQTAPVVFNLRDGATGAGTILWSVALIGQAGVAQPPVTLCGLQIPGTAATAMTLESAAAPAASNFAFATIQGHDAN
jgi:hypothetical protein